MDENTRAVENFRTYLKIPSVHPNVDYAPCEAFLTQQAAEIGLDLRKFQLVEKKPILVLTWTGSEPDLPTILLNSHMDVVPVYPELWTHDPFGAEVDDQGNIFGRGAQDMKCVGIQYLEAIRRLKASGVNPRRTVHVSFVPDEETGGSGGMHDFVQTEDFRSLRVGFSLDEGAPSPTETFSVYNSERSAWSIQVVCNGQEGHGSLLLPNTAGEKLRRFVDSMMDYRQSQVDRLAADPSLSLGDVTTVNLTMVQGGVQTNVVPPMLTATFDMRLALDVDHAQFQAMIASFAAAAGADVEVVYLSQRDKVPPTPLDDSNQFWVAMRGVFTSQNIKFATLTFPALTDGIYLRELNIPVLGFSPMNHTPWLLHANDEFLNREIFLAGIDLYSSIIPAVANA